MVYRVITVFIIASIGRDCGGGYGGCGDGGGGALMVLLPCVCLIFAFDIRVFFMGFIWVQLVM